MSAGASENVGVKLNSKIQLEAARAAGHSETFEKKSFYASCQRRNTC